MTKAEIIHELHCLGDVWANPSYTKKYLERHLEEARKAHAMTFEELYEIVHGHKRNSEQREERK